MYTLRLHIIIASSACDDWRQSLRYSRRLGFNGERSTEGEDRAEAAGQLGQYHKHSLISSHKKCMKLYNQSREFKIN